jgi:hypothetical protein
MFWYEPSAVGAFWDGLALDHHFGNSLDDWAAMRSSWTDNNGLYVAMKAGNMTGHQAHGDLVSSSSERRVRELTLLCPLPLRQDAGDFVLDAMGQRWAGELGSGNYLSTGYFASEVSSLSSCSSFKTEIDWMRLSHSAFVLPSRPKTPSDGSTTESEPRDRTPLLLTTETRTSTFSLRRPSTLPETPRCVRIHYGG